MRNLADCIQAAIDDKALNSDLGRRVQDEFRAQADAYMRSGVSEVAANTRAATDLIEARLADTRARRHATLNQLRVMQRSDARYANAHAADPDLVLKDLEWTEMEKRAIEKSLMSGIGDFLKEFHTNVLGNVRGRALLKDVVKELHLQASGNAQAHAIAQAVLKTYERARTMANELGMDIGKLDDFGMPHSHDAKKILKAGFQAWSDMVYRQLDWNRIIDRQTGKPFAVAKGSRPLRQDADRFLKDIYDSITTEGWRDRSPSMVPGGRSLAKSRGDQRFLHFRDADGWMDYNDAFGRQNPFDAVVTHLRGMASDIALMRNWGPSPEAGLEYATQVMKRDVHTAEGPAALKLRQTIDRKSRKAAVMLRILNGRANQAGNTFWANFFAGTRQMLTAAQLGAAPLSSITDLGSMAIAAKAIGLNPTSPWNMTIKSMTGAISAEQARDMGLILDTWMHAGSAEARFMGDVWSPELTSRISNFVLRANGLSFWTDHARVGVAAAFGSDLAEFAGHGFADLPPLLHNFMTNRGIGAREWDALRAPEAIFTDVQGGRHINADWFAEHTSLPRAEAEDIATRWGAMVQDHLEYAVPTSSLRGRATLLGEAAPGTFLGELGRSSFMYKSYALSQFFNQARRIAEMPGNLTSKALYAAFYVSTMTYLGAYAVQLKEIAKGNDPRPMASWSFLGAALTQGGGIGIFGDFFGAATDRSGRGIYETLGGPVVGLASDLMRASAGQLGAAAEGSKTSFGRSLVNIARRYNPLATFQPLLPVPIRAALERMVWDQLQWLVDPDADRQFRAAARKLKSDRDTEMFWPKGAALPSRGPDLGGAFRGAGP